MVVPQGRDGLKTPGGGSNGRSVRIYLARHGRTALNAWRSGPGVEAAGEVAIRALTALADIADGPWGHVAVVVSHDAVNRIALATLDPSLGHPEDVPQGTGCFNIVECHQGAMGQREWRVLGGNKVPPEVGELLSPTTAPPLLQ